MMGRVPVGNFEVNYMNGWHVALDEGFVVVEDFCGILNKCAGVAELRSCGPDQVAERLRGIRIALEAQGPRSHDIVKQKSFHFYEIAAGGKASGRLTAAVTLSGV